jgi:hypothetical protein
MKCPRLLGRIYTVAFLLIGTLSIVGCESGEHYAVADAIVAEVNAALVAERVCANGECHQRGFILWSGSPGRRVTIEVCGAARESVRAQVEKRARWRLKAHPGWRATVRFYPEPPEPSVCGSRQRVRHSITIP